MPGEGSQRPEPYDFWEGDTGAAISEGHDGLVLQVLAKLQSGFPAAMEETAAVAAAEVKTFYWEDANRNRQQTGRSEYLPSLSSLAGRFPLVPLLADPKRASQPA